jgi:NADH-quinone oxidoreductase subunit N
VGDWQQIVAFLSVASMFLGAIAAIGQTDIKRLMAYSSIAHMGFALMGLAAGTAQGVQAMLIYMAIYVTMNVGTFAFILTMEKDGRRSPRSPRCRASPAASRTKALAHAGADVQPRGRAAAGGLLRQVRVLLAAVDAGLVWLAVAGVIASVIGAFYYLRIVYLMYFGETARGAGRPMGILRAMRADGAAALMLLGVINLFGIEAPGAAAAEMLVR